MSTERKPVCPACGGEDLVQGFLTAIGPYGGIVKFTEKPKYYKVTSRNVVQGRKCKHCGNVQFYVEIR